MARQAKFEKEELLRLVENYAADGYQDNEIAACLGVHPNTFARWKKCGRYPELEGALMVGRQRAVSKVMNALFKRATGYEVTEEWRIVTERPGKNGETIRTVKTVVKTKTVPPNAKAIEAYLKRYAPDAGDREEALGKFLAEFSQLRSNPEELYPELNAEDAEIPYELDETDEELISAEESPPSEEELISAEESPPSVDSNAEKGDN